MSCVDIRKILAFAAAVLLSLPTTMRSSLGEDNKTTTVTYSSPKEKYAYSLPGYRVSSNAWGAGKLVEGVDYSTYVTFDPDNFEKGTSFSWKYPGSVGGVYAYPHIDYAAKAAGVSTLIADIGKLSATYDVQLTNSADSTIAFDLWFNSKPNGGWTTTNAELLIEVHATSRGRPNQSFVLAGADFAGATVHVSNTSAAGASWKFIDVKMPTHTMSGTLSISDVIKGLVRNGVLTGKEYLASLQFGSEVLGGSGGLRISKLRYDWTAIPPAGSPK